MKTTYSLAYEGTNSLGASFSKTIGGVLQTILPDQATATNIARKLEKLYDSGTTITGVSLIEKKTYDTEEA